MQVPRAHEVRELRREPTAATVLDLKIPHYILKLKIIPTNKYGSKPTAKKLLLTEKHNRTQSGDRGIMGSSALMYTFSTQLLHPGIRINCRRGGRKIARPEDQEVCYEAMSPRKDCLNKA